MKQAMKFGLIALALVAVASAAYWAGRKGGTADEPGGARPAAAGEPTQASQAARTGVAIAPEHLDYVHFRVGNRNVKHLFLEGSVLWLGTSGGLIRFDTHNGAFTAYDNQSGLLSNGVFHVSRVGGELHVGTYGGGLSILGASGEWRNVNIPQGLADAFVYDLLSLPSGDMWIATWSGANLVQGGDLGTRARWSTFTVENTGGGLPNDWVYGLELGRKGEIWFATEGGLARFAQGRWDRWNHADGLGADYDRVKNDISYGEDPAKVSEHHARQKAEMNLQKVDVAYNPNYIVALAVDAAGVVWAGTWGGGLSRFDGRQWKTYTVAEGLPGNHVFALHVDRAGELWIGTNNGLAQLQGESFRTLTTHDGLFSNTVFSITSAEDGSLWVGGFGGIAHLRRPR